MKKFLICTKKVHISSIFAEKTILKLKSLALMQCCLFFVAGLDKKNVSISFKNLFEFMAKKHLKKMLL